MGVVDTKIPYLYDAVTKHLLDVMFLHECLTFSQGLLLSSATSFSRTTLRGGHDVDSEDDYFATCLPGSSGKKDAPCDVRENG